MMDAQSLQERIDRVEGKRELLLKFQADPNLGDLSLDVDQALIEMDDLMSEFRRTFPSGIIEPLRE
ncbi:hypothetical protein [Chamaesiphon sp. VAR_48_metabat_135_sub]|uniref:hypothetical protein n=1 Tax=Chamaesiphon sp. VAR_48_metabat_135_sub TaxID=2964699 RepID=UPI00286C5F67|nr:hypothetical protein [Chamaesiphon sp. VAR_48_metabat_135_sub]